MPERLACDEAMNLSRARLKVHDSDLKNGEVMKTQASAVSYPWGLQGDFAVVYKFRTQSGKLRALRCYLTPMKADIQYRYERIGAYFARHIPDITANFKYHNDGILINEQGQGGQPTKKAHSLIEMEWIEGTTLPEYIAMLCQRRDQAGLGDLVDQWVALITALRNAHIAHCDLAGGNIMVKQNGRLVLVDYDGVYIPDFAGMAGVVDGQADYQHPDVAHRPFNEQADTFSFMVIYAALLALHLRPELWQTYALQDSRNKTLDTNLLFKRQDFLDPDGSRLFSELETINDTRLGAVVRDLKQACRQPVTQVQLPLYIGDPEKEALDKLEKAIQQDDDEGIVEAWIPHVLDRYGPAQHHVWRVAQARQVVKALKNLQDALKIGSLSLIAKTYDPAIVNCKSFTSEQGEQLLLALELAQAYATEDDQMIVAAWQSIEDSRFKRMFTLTAQEQQRLGVARQRKEALVQFRLALMKKNIQPIVASYSPSLLDQSSAITARERELLQVAQDFARAYQRDDDQAIVAAAEAIQNLSYRADLVFTTQEKQRIELAQQRKVALKNLMERVRNSRIPEAPKQEIKLFERVRNSRIPEAPKQEIKLFYCYARADKALRDELELHLSNLRRQYHLTNWHDREILPGENWEQAIDAHLNTAHVIFLLISPHFMASDYCYGKEMDKALKREKAGTCCVIPVLLRPTDWEDAPFSHLQLLPTDARPVTSWPDRDNAFWDIAKETRKAIKKLLVVLKTKEEWLEEGRTFYDLMRYEEALMAFDQAVRLDPNNADAFNGKGTALYDLMRYEEALMAFDQAIRLDSNFAIAQRNKGVALHNLKQYEEALIAFDRAISLDPNFAIAYYNKGNTLYSLMRYEEALAVFDQATRLNPGFVKAYTAKGGILGMLGRYEEALSICEQAIRLDPNDTFAYLNKGYALGALRRHNEELATYEQAIHLDPNFAPAYYNKGITLKNLGKIKEAEQAFEKARQLGFMN